VQLTRARKIDWRFTETRYHSISKTGSRSDLVNGKPLLGNGGTSLTIAQRFNAGFRNCAKIESREGRKKLSVVPMGLNNEEPK